ncbi:MAG: hypothetical protein STHCBS139747_004227 [Sporothrix thermara]
MASYTNPAVPADGSVDPRAVAFFDSFYKTSDTPTAHEEYARSFLPDATFVLASKKAVGYDQILATRQAMWATITSRKHTIYKIFSFGPQSKEFMLYGHVKHTPETGKDIEKEWAGRVELAEDANGELKFKFYQDTAAPAS